MECFETAVTAGAPAIQCRHAGKFVGYGPSRGLPARIVSTSGIEAEPAWTPDLQKAPDEVFATMGGLRGQCLSFGPRLVPGRDGRPPVQCEPLYRDPGSEMAKAVPWARNSGQAEQILNPG